MSRLSRFIKRLRATRYPVRARHIEPSFLISTDDDPATADDVLLDLSLKAIELARHINLDDIVGRGKPICQFVGLWPGAHYRLLSAMVKILNPKMVVEIGTATGASALAMLKFMASDSHLYTFDLVPWRESPGHILTDEDFRDGRLVQVIDDLTVRDGLMRHVEVVRSAQLIFMDAAKDGLMEDRFLGLLGEVQFTGRAIVILDDIRLYNMLATWRRIASPKIDLTSFGHFTGTGVVNTPIRLKEHC